MSFRWLLILIMLQVLLWPAMAAAGETAYEQWLSGDDRLEKVISELDELIAKAERAKAANPAFLRDLQKIIARYRQPRRSVYFFDDFNDGDFTVKPAWTVSSGDFKVDLFNSLGSTVAVQRPRAEKQTEGKKEDKNLKLLLGIVRELTKEEGGNQGAAEPAAPASAIIRSTAEIPNAFTIRFTLRASGEWGSTAIGVMQGNEVYSGYHLVYNAAPSAERPMQLVKYRRGAAVVLAGAGAGSPVLEDGAEHEIIWSRGVNGEMTVAVDRKEVLRSSDLADRAGFAGIAVINNGGTYSYDNIEVFTEK